jgi:ABC-type amino acid transport substrate-binding protein
MMRDCAKIFDGPSMYRSLIVIAQWSRCLTLAFLLLVILNLGFPAAAAEKDLASPKDIQSILARGTIRVAVTKFDLPAFHWRDGSGELAGPEIDLGRLIGRSMKVGVEFIDDCPTFEAVVDAVASGRADIGISKLSQTPLRLLRVRFSDPYLTLRQAFLFNRIFVGAEAAGRPPEEVLRKFGGTIGVVAKSAYVDHAQRNFPDAQLSELQTWEDAVEALLNGRVEALYRDEFEVRRVLKKDPTLNVRFGSAGLSDMKALLSIAICDTCTRLQEFVNFQIAENRVPFVLARLLATEATK